MGIFLISPHSIRGHQAILDPAESHHLTHVLRKKVGDCVTLSTGHGETLEARLIQTKDRAVLEILSTKKTLDGNSPQIILAPALLKGPRMDWLIEKATELGVAQIVPFLSQRGVIKVKTETDKTKKIRRWQAISQAALKQSKRSVLPQIGPLLSFHETLERFGTLGILKILFAPSSQSDLPFKRLEEIVSSHHNDPFWMILIGPEGGLTPQEMKTATKNSNFVFSTLGDITLRAETAAIAALSIINFLKQK